MKYDMFAEVARKLVKQRINSGQANPLVLQSASLLAEVQKQNPSITLEDLRNAVNRFIKEKALEQSDGQWLTFNLHFIDDVRP